MRYVVAVWIITAIVPPIQGSVILARNGNEALFLWDASPYVAQLVAERKTGPEGLHLLEATAISELAKRARASRAKYLRMKVLYMRTGAVSKMYGGRIFAGVEHIVNLGASRRDLLLYGSSWSAEFARGEPVGAVQAHLKIEVTGKLPPPR